MTGEAIDALEAAIRDCELCPRRCRVDRTAGEVGACRTGEHPHVASAAPHFGEEPVLVGRGGSGTIFFSGCNLDCVFCQNDDISHGTPGPAVPPDRLADLMLELEGHGCENINFVTPSHVAHAVARAVDIARRRGLAVPTVYNSGGYDAVETVARLDGLIDIYMPDFKWADGEAAATYSGAPGYPEIAAAALAEMYGQVGPLELDDRRVATRGVLVRHLVMPGDLAESRRVIDRVAEAAPGCAVNVMGQYRPAYRAREFHELVGRPEHHEVEALRAYATEQGLVRVDR